MQDQQDSPETVASSVKASYHCSTMATSSSEFVKETIEQATASSCLSSTTADPSTTDTVSLSEDEEEVEDITDKPEATGNSSSKVISLLDQLRALLRQKSLEAGK